VNRLLRALSASCDETALLLSDYAEGELGHLRRWRIEAHLAACDGCRGVYRALLETVETLRALGEVEPEAQPELAEAVRRRIDPGA
jgi:predicted anti-sigma-YlaC factor YlaD